MLQRSALKFRLSHPFFMISVLLACCVIVFPSFSWDEVVLTSGQPGEYAGFGMALGIQDDILAVGEYIGGDNESGRVWLYRLQADAWTEVGSILPQDASYGQQFGFSLALSDPWLVVGAPNDSEVAEYAGAVYVFSRNGSTWTEEAKLVVQNGTAADNFGYSVAIQGNWILVGAKYDDINGENSGSACVFIHNGENWEQEACLTPDDACEQQEFGMAVSLQDDYAFIGAPMDCQLQVGQGAVYVFRREAGSWIQQQKLFSDDPDMMDWFGSSLSANSSHLLIGAWQDGEAGEAAGAVYDFRNVEGQFQQTSKIITDDAEAWDWFGSSLMIDEDRLVVGAPWDDDMGQVSGSAYLFEFQDTSWIQLEKFISAEGVTGDHLGMACALAGDCIVTGSINAEVNGMYGAGKATVFMNQMSRHETEMGVMPSTLVVNAHPNPFNAMTRIHIQTGRPGTLVLVVYDVLGRKVQSLAEAIPVNGEMEFTFDASRLAAGQYYLIADLKRQERHVLPMILVK